MVVMIVVDKITLLESAITNIARGIKIVDVVAVVIFPIAAAGAEATVDSEATADVDEDVLILPTHHIPNCPQSTKARHPCLEQVNWTKLWARAVSSSCPDVR